MYNIKLGTDKPDIDGMKRVVSKLMERGVRVNDCARLYRYYKDLSESLKYVISSKYGIANPNSSKQVIGYISELSASFDKNCKNEIIDICYDEQAGKWTSKAEALEKLSDLGYEFARELLDFRKASKYASYISSFMDAADSKGLVHPKVSLTKTHRINYSEPGLMSIPKKLLWHMVAPYREGDKLYSVDIKNQEPSILINMTGADSLKEALTNEQGLYETLFKKCFEPKVTANVLLDTFLEDRRYSFKEIEALGTVSPIKYHPVRADFDGLYYKGERVVNLETVCIGSSKGVKADLPNSVLIGTDKGNTYRVKVTWDEASAEKFAKSKSVDYSIEGKLTGFDVRISKAARKEFKTAWNAISYGASCAGVESMCKVIDGKKTYKFITQIDELKQYRSMVAKWARAGHRGLNTFFGTYVNAGNEASGRALERILLDLPIQGTGADILSLLIKRFYDYRKEHGLTGKMWLYYSRHDELIIEVDGDWESEVGQQEVENILRDMLEHQIEDWEPFKLEVGPVNAEELGIEDDDEQ